MTIHRSDLQKNNFKDSLNTSLFGDDEPNLVNPNKILSKKISESTHVKKIDLGNRVQVAKFTSKPCFLCHTFSRREFDGVHSGAVPASRIERSVQSLCGSVHLGTQKRLSTILPRQLCGQGGTVDLGKKRGPHLNENEGVPAEGEKLGKFN